MIQELTPYFKEFLKHSDPGEKLFFYNANEYPHGAGEPSFGTKTREPSKGAIKELYHLLLKPPFKQKLQLGSMQLGKSPLVFILTAWYPQEMNGAVHVSFYTLDNLVHTQSWLDDIFVECLKKSPIKGEFLGTELGII